LVEVLFVIAVPNGIVCQYQVSPTGTLPTLVSVTPGVEHCGLLLIGLPGFTGSGFIVKVNRLVAVPLAVVTAIVPVVPLPTIAVI